MSVPNNTRSFGVRAHAQTEPRINGVKSISDFTLYSLKHSSECQSAVGISRTIYASIYTGSTFCINLAVSFCLVRKYYIELLLLGNTQDAQNIKCYFSVVFLELAIAILSMKKIFVTLNFITIHCKIAKYFLNETFLSFHPFSRPHQKAV